MALLVLAFYVVAVAFSVVAVYLLFLAGVYLLTRRREVPNALPRRKFAVVVPAHNEEGVLGRSVQSILALDYPTTLFDVYVVADNCTDNTAAIAQESGAACLIRDDTLHPGKGYALRRAFDTLSKEGYDAFVVIDADTKVSPNLLSAFNNRLALGQKVIQCRYLFSGAERTPLAYLLYVGKYVENALLWEPKSRLGMPVILQGNGMCIAAEILQSVPWDAFSITEDAEYSFSLIREHVGINYAAETEVTTPPAASYGQTFKQRLRWSSGNARLFRNRFFHMLFHSLKNRRLGCLDAALSIILNSKLALITISTVALAASVLLYLGVGRGLPRFFPIWFGALFVSLVAYFVIGILISKLTAKRMKLLLLSPVSLIYLCLLFIAGSLGLRQKVWARTPRDSQTSHGGLSS